MGAWYWDICSLVKEAAIRPFDLQNGCRWNYKPLLTTRITESETEAEGTFVSVCISHINNLHHWVTRTICVARMFLFLWVNPIHISTDYRRHEALNEFLCERSIKIGTLLPCLPPGYAIESNDLRLPGWHTEHLQGTCGLLLASSAFNELWRRFTFNELWRRFRFYTHFRNFKCFKKLTYICRLIYFL